MSTFTVAGVSVCKGNVKVRFCSDLVLRIKNLQKQGDEDIQLVELPTPMNKVQACQYLLDSGQFEKFAFDIREIQGKKGNIKPVVAVQPKLKKVEVVVDQEIEELKELAAA